MREGNAIAVIASIVVVVLILTFFGGGMMGRGHMWGWDGDGWGTWWGLGMMILWTLIIAGVILGAIWLIRQSSSSESDGSFQDDGAIRALRERYARGEIDKVEFDRIRRELE